MPSDVCSIGGISHTEEHLGCLSMQPLAFERLIDRVIDWEVKPMSAPDENCESDEFRASLTRLPQLADATIQLNVAKELEQLHHAVAWIRPLAAVRRRWRNMRTYESC